MSTQNVCCKNDFHFWSGFHVLLSLVGKYGKYNRMKVKVKNKGKLKSLTGNVLDMKRMVKRDVL